MKCVYLSASDRRLYRECLVSPDEVFCSCLITEPGEHSRPAPRGRYDVHEFLKGLPATYRQPDLLAYHFDYYHHSVPVNVGQVKCPKVLIVGDTHHLQQPIRRAIDYARAERFDLIVLEFTRQHAHFFREAGLMNVVWIPCFSLSPYQHTPGPRAYGVVFAGNCNLHPYRKYVLDYFDTVRMPLLRVGGTPEQMSDIYRQTRINLNVSLNGDLNLRNLEVMAAGGFLLTDRLSPESGIEQLFQDRRHLAYFDSPDHMRDLIMHYSENPEEAEAIARAGHREYFQRHRPEIKIGELLAALDGNVSDQRRVELDRRTALPPEDFKKLAGRIELYEALQETHRVNPSRVDVVFWPGLEREATDAVDLPRLRISLLTHRTVCSTLHTTGLENRIERVLIPMSNADRKWGAICVPASQLEDPGLHQLLQFKCAQVVIVAHFEGLRHQASLQRLLAQSGARSISAQPPVLVIPDAHVGNARGQSANTGYRV